MKFKSDVKIESTTSSTSTTSGALVVSGGLGVAGDINGAIAYSPVDSNNWFTVPNKIHLAVDELAELTSSNYMVRSFSDFSGTTTAIDTMVDWIANNSGTSATTSNVAGETGRPGILRLSTGTTATGRASVNLGTSNILLGNMNLQTATSVRIPVLSDSTNRFAFSIGLHDAVTMDAVDGCYFQYDQATSPNWRTVTINNSVSTKNTTSVAIVAGSWVKLEMVINTSNVVTFYINDVLVATHSTNVPITTGRETAPSILLLKSLGTTSRNVDVDYFAMTYEVPAR